MPGVPPNAIPLLKSKLKSLFGRKKTRPSDEPTKTENPAAVPTEAAAAKAATDPVAAAASEPTETITAAAPEPATTDAVPEMKTVDPVKAKDVVAGPTAEPFATETAVEKSTEETPAPVAPAAPTAVAIA